MTINFRMHNKEIIIFICLWSPIGAFICKMARFPTLKTTHSPSGSTPSTLFPSLPCPPPWSCRPPPPSHLSRRFFGGRLERFCVVCPCKKIALAPFALVEQFPLIRTIFFHGQLSCWVPTVTIGGWIIRAELGRCALRSLCITRGRRRGVGGSRRPVTRGRGRRGPVTCGRIWGGRRGLISSINWRWSRDSTHWPIRRSLPAWVFWWRKPWAEKKGRGRIKAPHLTIHLQDYCMKSSSLEEALMVELLAVSDQNFGTLWKRWEHYEKNNPKKRWDELANFEGGMRNRDIGSWFCMIKRSLMFRSQPLRQPSNIFPTPRTTFRKLIVTW